jgi:hypothetical protein
VCGLLRSEVFLFGIIRPGTEEEAGAVAFRDFLGGVGAAGVDDDDLVGDRGQGSQRTREPFLLVEGDQAGGNGVHWRDDAARIAASISQMRGAECWMTISARDTAAP